ncbi:MAG: glycosyltransferase [Ignavibacteriales bacterium]|nr:glycosyltransferase [Ignavibacteriales bacterium]
MKQQRLQADKSQQEVQATQNKQDNAPVEPKPVEQRINEPRSSEPRNPENRNPETRNSAPRNPEQRRPQTRRPAPPPQRQAQNNDRISIVVPLYNEEESLRPLAEAIKKAMGNYNNNYEVIFVDDGSTDRSAVILKELCREERRFKFISFQKNYGKSAALHVGFQAVAGDLVVTMDADLQDDPNEIPNLIRRLKDGYDLVSGWKKVRYDPFIKKYSSRFFNKITGMMSGIKIHDFNCGLKAYKRPVVKSLNVYGEMHRYLPVLAKWQGFSVTEVVVKHHPRKFGKTKFGISRFFKGFVDLLTVMFVTRYIKRPMHLFGFFGALAFLLGFIVNGYLSIEWFMGKQLSNRPMLFLGILLIIVGVQFFSTGLLGEMIVHTQQDNKEYRIKDKQLKV